MNIFYLDPDPAIAASMHCDQHLNKMILESAQMLSTASGADIYKPTHTKHPCVRWLLADDANIAYLCKLALALEDVRQSLANVSQHASIPVILECVQYLNLSAPLEEYPTPDIPIFCGPPIIKLRYAHLTVEHKYQAYYVYKARSWALDGKPLMSYKGRSVPEFLKCSKYVRQ